jgi:hypothetical protein
MVVVIVVMNVICMEGLVVGKKTVFAVEKVIIVVVTVVIVIVIIVIAGIVIVVVVCSFANVQGFLKMLILCCHLRNENCKYSNRKLNA